MSTWRDDVATTLALLGGQGSLEEIYREIATVRTNPLPTNWRALVRKILETNSSDSIAFGGRYDLFYSVSGVRRGVWGLRDSTLVTPSASDIGNVRPGRIIATTYRILRETRLARDLKRLHRDKCQMCGATIRIGQRTYSEAHHLQPLGGTHGGPDIPSNIVVLCPNHHAWLDYGGTELTMSMFNLVRGHTVGQQYVDYHNQKVWCAE